jgi:DNA polymerase-3 subunit beta
MQLIIERASLLKSLNHVQSVVERRNTIPILSHVLLEAKDGGLRLTATDMDLEIVEQVSADVRAPGAATAPAHTFYDIVRKLPDGSQIEIATAADSATLTVRAGRSQFRLGSLAVEDFPAITAEDLPHSFALAPKDLKMLIDRAAFAASTEETRYYLNGIFLHPAESDGVATLRAVATDGHRLARVEMPLPEGAEAMPGIIVPRKTVTELRKLVEDAAGEVRVAVSDSKASFGFSGVNLTSKLIDGTFPDYQRVIPAGNNQVLEVDARLFAEAVDRVSTISSEKSRAVKLSLAANQMTLSATGADVGSADEELEIGYAGTPMEIGFNSRYLLDITRQIEGDGARLSLADAASPTIIQDGADRSALYVLMPMRV